MSWPTEEPEPERTRERMPERRPERPPSSNERGDDRPALPRRRRQANLAPQLAQPTPPPLDNASPHTGTERARTPEQARDLLSAIETGTRQGRRRPPEPRTDEREEREGHGNFQHP
ncbi:MAG TPA: hypothetical protein VHC18_16020 [Amycolatopsis sp.]|nr:hypothetical protein [Amycolatopsis sp.]